MIALTAIAAVTGTTGAGWSAPSSTANASPASRHRTTEPLDLGPADLQESRTITRVQRGVTLTQITRGGSDRSLFWTLESLIESTATSPDPDAPARVLSDRASARAQADRLRAKGFHPRIEPVHHPATADVRAGVLGYRVRIGTFATQAAADRVKSDLAAAGETANTVYTGWDGARDARGPWHLNVVRIDPRRFRGTLRASFGPDLFNRETTSALSRAAGAKLGINGGYFVLDPASGAPGDPAGVGVYNGRVLSEAINDRPALVLHPRARHTTVKRLSWRGRIRIGGRAIRLDGINRVPGLIRNCGGDRTDRPTRRPLHDITCTDGSELVAFTAAYGDRTPPGPGREIVLDRHRMVRATSATRGTSLPHGWMSVQGTGDSADALAAVRIGDVAPITTRLLTGTHHRQRVTRRTTIVNGGPLLVRHAHTFITQRRDGFVHPGDPSFAYGFVLKRNPRTFAGVDAHGRTVLITVDGRTTEDLGLSLPETAAVARSLGLVQAINLDGGGSTTMTRDGRVISHPSDPTGERPVGDALLVMPRHRR
jgi:hypothetical protein